MTLPSHAPVSAEVRVGDALELLRAMPADSAQVCVTSPPYWGLRDYGHAGQLGIEPSPEAYVAHLVEVFEEVRRVLRPDGVLWLNLGDSYAREHSRRSARPVKQSTSGSGDGAMRRADRPRHRVQSFGAKAKDLMGMPWRVAFGLQAAGWYLRCDIIWAKPSATPEGCTDRPSRVHEYLFLLSRSERYYYDSEAVKEPAASLDPKSPSYRPNSAKIASGAGRKVFNAKTKSARSYSASRRNRRSVWTIATTPYKGAHFATFPEELPKICILAGSRPGDLVLDPFAGSGTTGAVALKEGRSFIGCELNPSYAELARRRMVVTPALPFGRQSAVLLGEE